MSSEEFQGWRIYYQIEPFGDYAQDYRWSTLLTLLFNQNRKKGSRRYNRSDFSLAEEEYRDFEDDSASLFQRLKKGLLGG